MAAKRPLGVIFIHGLAKKPAPEKLAELWLWGLSRGNPMPSVFAAPNEGIDLPNDGVPHLFNYYADVFYGIDYETDVSSYYESEQSLEQQLHTEGLDQLDIVPAAPVTPHEQAFIANLEAKLAANMAIKPATAAIESATQPTVTGDHEIARFIPPVAREAIIKKAAMEAYYFLFDKEYTRPDGTRFQVRKELRTRLLDQLQALREQTDKTVIVSHSMGTMVAYDVLRNCADCPPVDTLFTLGSPLGIREIQQELRAAGTRQVDFPAAALRRWINIYDPLDPVCGADPRFANDYQAVDGKRVEDIKESNWGSWRHTITHYLAGSQFRKHLLQSLET